jgi:hypothetical protein
LAVWPTGANLLALWATPPTLQRVISRQYGYFVTYCVHA